MIPSGMNKHADLITDLVAWVEISSNLACGEPAKFPHTCY